MTKVSIASQKGGVGKTTLAINLAYSLAQRGWKTLLLDTDPQGSVGLSLTEKASSRAGFFDALCGDNLTDLFLETRIPGFHIVTAGNYNRFQNSPLSLDPETRRERTGQVIDGLNQLDHDIALIDTAGGTHSVTGDVLWHSEQVLLPELAEPLGLRTLPQILHHMAELRVKEPPTRVVGIVPTMVQTDQAISLNIVRKLREIIPAELLFKTSIPRDPAFLQASEYGVPLALLSQNPPPAALIFDQLAAELEERLPLTHATPPPHELSRLLD